MAEAQQARRASLHRRPDRATMAKASANTKNLNKGRPLPAKDLPLFAWSTIRHCLKQGNLTDCEAHRLCQKACARLRTPANANI